MAKGQTITLTETGEERRVEMTPAHGNYTETCVLHLSAQPVSDRRVVICDEELLVGLLEEIGDLRRRVHAS